MIKSSRTLRLRTMVAGSAASLVAVSGVLASAGTASADTTITAQYPVTGSTHLAAPDVTLPVGPGTLTATVDLNTDTVTGSFSLPDATGSFKELNLVPVSATAQFINDGPATGTVNPDTGAVTSTAKITIRLVSLTVAGIPQLIGTSCETATPVTLKASSQPGFNILKGGNLAGTYTIPPFARCLVDTILINLTLPGPGNTITFTLGRAKVIGSPSRGAR
jgi:hypothetical protein